MYLVELILREGRHFLDRIFFPYETLQEIENNVLKKVEDFMNGYPCSSYAYYYNSDTNIIDCSDGRIIRDDHLLYLGEKISRTVQAITRRKCSYLQVVFEIKKFGNIINKDPKKFLALYDIIVEEEFRTDKFYDNKAVDEFFSEEKYLYRKHDLGLLSDEELWKFWSNK